MGIKKAIKRSAHYFGTLTSAGRYGARVTQTPVFTIDNAPTKTSNYNLQSGRSAISLSGFNRKNSISALPTQQSEPFLKTDPDKPDRRFTAVLLGLSLVLVIYIYWSAVPRLLQFWERPDYSHAYMVPPLLAWIFWNERKRLAAASGGGCKFAYLFLAATVALFTLGSFGGILALVFMSLWTLLLALLGLFYGDKGLKVLWPLALTALFAVPWPAFIFRTASFQLRLLSSYLAELLLRALSIPVYREGNIIDLGSIQLEVVDACSGLRYLLPSILIAVLAGWLFLRRPLTRVVLVAMSVPVAVFSNAFRIMITGVLCRWFGPEMAEGFFHDFSGWLVYVVSLLILLLLLRLLRKFENRRPDKLPAPPPERDFRPAEFLPGRRGLCVLLAVLIALAAVTVWGSRPGPRPEYRNLAQFPRQLGDWRGTPIHLDDLVIESLGTGDVFNAAYVNDKSGHSLYFLISYYAEQDSGAAAHAPASCLLGGGWSIINKSEIPPENNPHNMPLGRMLLKKQNAYIVSNFWFQQRGRIISNEFLNKIYLFVDALKTRRTDGGLVRIELLMRPGMTPEQGQAVVDEFIKLLRPEIPKYIPG